MSDAELFRKWFTRVVTPAQVEEHCGTPEPWDDHAVANDVLRPIYHGDSWLDDPREAAYALLKRGVRHGYSEPGVIQYWFAST